jgi:hypothetical protein
VTRSVFLSYRRDDSGGHTGRLYDKLVQELGGERVFLDIDNVPVGVDFVDAIDQTLDQCVVVVVMIGPRWLAAAAADGTRRIDRIDDFHRLEIERALQRKRRVVPVLVGGAQMPGQTDLPESIGALARRNAFELTDRRFGYDAAKLAEFLKGALLEEERRQQEQEQQAQAERERLQRARQEQEAQAFAAQQAALRQAQEERERRAKEERERQAKEERERQANDERERKARRDREAQEAKAAQERALHERSAQMHKDVPAARSAEAPPTDRRHQSAADAGHAEGRQVPAGMARRYWLVLPVGGAVASVAAALKWLPTARQATPTEAAPTGAPAEAAQKPPPPASTAAAALAPSPAPTVTSAPAAAARTGWSPRVSRSSDLLGHTANVWTLAFSPDSTLLASAGFDKRIFLWRTDGGERVRDWAAHGYAISSLAFSPNGKQLLSSSDERRGNLRLWDVASGRPIRSFDGQAFGLVQVAFSPDGTRIASGGGPRGTAAIWDAQTGRQIHVFADDSYTFAVAFSPDGRTLATGTDRATYIYDVASGKRLNAFKPGTDVRAVQFSTQGDLLATAGEEYRVKIRKVSDWSLVATLRANNVVNMAFTPDGKRLSTVSGTSDVGIQIWDIASQSLLLSDNQKTPTYGGAISSDGRLVAMRYDKVVKLWQIES